MRTIPLCRLGDQLQPVGKWTPEGAGAFTYIDISAIDQNTKAIRSPQRLPLDDAPSRARQIVRSGDVLVSTVRPNLNAVASVPDELDGVIASTGFTVMRPQSQSLDQRYLYHWVQTKEFISYLVSRATGASYPAVSDGIVKDARIPLPPVAEQRRIAAILDKADAIRRKRQQALETNERLEHSLFLHSVGPRAKEYTHWKSVTIEALAHPRKGAMRTGPFGSDLRHSEFVEEGIAVLGIDNAVQNRFAWGERRFITTEKYDRLKRYTVFPGDVIVTIMGTTGRSAVVPNDIPLAITTKHLATITADRSKVEPEFLSNALHRHPAVLAQIAKANKGAIMDGLNLSIIKGLQVPLPPRQVQGQYVAELGRIRATGQKIQDQLHEANTLFASLSQRAFRGKL